MQDDSPKPEMIVVSIRTDESTHALTAIWEPHFNDRACMLGRLFGDLAHHECSSNAMVVLATAIEQVAEVWVGGQQPISPAFQFANRLVMSAKQFLTRWEEYVQCEKQREEWARRWN